MRLRPQLRLLGALGILAAVLVLAHSVAGLGTGLMLLSPALVLLLPLLAGRYVGEETLTRWRAAFVPRRRRAVAAIAARLPRADRATSADGGALLAAGIGRRGPPARLLLPV